MNNTPPPITKLTDEQLFIQQARDLLRPHPVDYGMIPSWFGFHEIHLRRLGEAGLLDHWGMVTVDGIPYFVTEPYDIDRAGFD